MAFEEIAGETPEDRLIRLCHTACTWAEVKFCGVRKGLCYFEVWYDSDGDMDEHLDNDSDDSDDRQREILSVSVPAAGLTGQSAVEQMIKEINAKIERDDPIR